MFNENKMMKVYSFKDIFSEMVWWDLFENKMKSSEKIKSAY